MGININYMNNFFASYIIKAFPLFVGSFFSDSTRGISVVTLRDARFLRPVLSILVGSHFFRVNQILDIWAVDYPSSPNRFQINYMLLSLENNFRLCLRVPLEGGIQPSIDSVVDLFPSAGWLEREVWDMHGVLFVGNPDLRRILTDYGFEGHPLRKDFPLSGYLQVRYDDELKQIISEPVSFTQEYRYFDFLSPWSGSKLD